MRCPHGVQERDICTGCGGLARVCVECSRIAGRCWRHTNVSVVVPPYTFRQFEPIDSTVYPYVVSDVGVPAVAPPAVASGMSWAPPPAVTLERAEPAGPMLALERVDA